MYQVLDDRSHFGASRGLTIFFPSAPVHDVNPNPHQKLNFCACPHLRAGLMLSICPERPGAAS